MNNNVLNFVESKDRNILSIIQWIDENLDGRYECEFNLKIIDKQPDGSYLTRFINHYIFKFEMEEDAVAFKLRWI